MNTQQATLNRNVPYNFKFDNFSQFTVPLFVIALGVLSIILVVWTNKINEGRFQVSMSADIISDIRHEVVNLHLTLLGTIDNEKLISAKEVEKHIMSVTYYVDSLAEGGLAHHGFVLNPVQNQTFVDGLSKVRMAVIRFEEAIQQISPNDAIFSPAFIQKRVLNGAFSELMGQVKKLAEIVDGQIDPRIYRAEKIYHVGLLLWSVFLLAITLVILKITMAHRVTMMALADSEEKCRTLFENANDAIFLWERTGANKRGRLLESNAVACNLLGICVDEMGTLSPEKFEVLGSTPDFKDMMGKLTTDGAVTHEVLYKQSTGVEIPVEVSSTLLPFAKGQAILSIARDISRRKQLEKELVRTSTLEAMQVLAGGISHDFNNLFTIIKGYAFLAKEGIDVKGPVFEGIKIIEASAEQGAELTMRLLTYAEGGALYKETVDLVCLLKENVAFVLKGTKTNCHYDIERNLWNVQADAQKLNQVLKSLMVNAKDASGGVKPIEIVIRNVIVDDFSIPELQAGRYVKLIIADKGRGLLEEDTQKVFDPYYSTKERTVIKGMGLSLALCHSIVRRHGGHLTFESKKGFGTTVQLFLPVESNSFRGGRGLLGDGGGNREGKCVESSNGEKGCAVTNHNDMVGNRRREKRFPLVASKEMTSELLKLRNVVAIGCGVVGKVIDISEHGVGLTHTKRQALPLSECHLDLYSSSSVIKKIPGRIASDIHFDDSGELLSGRCGIEFIALDNKLQQQIKEMISKHASAD